MIGLTDKGAWRRKDGPETPRRRQRNVAAQESASEVALTTAPSLFLTQSARAALFGLDAFEANLRIWRGVLDAMREAGRAQQNAALESVRLQLKRGDHLGEQADEGPALFAPFLAARRAYEQIGDAVLSAQRQALDTMSAEAQPH